MHDTVYTYVQIAVPCLGDGVNENVQTKYSKKVGFIMCAGYNGPSTSNVFYIDPLNTRCIDISVSGTGVSSVMSNSIKKKKGQKTCVIFF